MDPDYPEAHEVVHGLMLALDKLGKRKEAIARARQAVRLAPFEVRMHMGLVWTLNADGQNQEALAAARELVRIAPQDATAHMTLAWMLEEAQLADEAIGVYETVVALDATIEPALHALGVYHARRGDHARAIDLLLRAEALGSEDPTAPRNLGHLFKKEGRFEEAVLHYRKAVERAPQDAEEAIWLLDFGACLEGAGQNGEAARVYKRGLSALEKLPATEQLTAICCKGVIPQAYEHLARAALGDGRKDEARGHLRQALDVNRRLAGSPGASAEDLNRCAWALLTCEVEELRDPRQALPLAEKANELSGGKVPAYLDTLALACFLNGDVPRAVEVERKALSLLPPPGRAPKVEALRGELEASLKRFEAEDRKKPARRKKA